MISAVESAMFMEACKSEFDEGCALHGPSGDWGMTRESSASFPFYLAPHLRAEGLLGEGATSYVFRAVHTRLNLRVAVKVLRQSRQNQVQVRERLLREAELCTRVTNRSIPRVYDVDTLPDGRPYVVMEEIVGRTLDEVLRYGPLETELATAIVCDILGALADLHRAGIVHRDLKPANLVLEDHNGTLRIRILDLGVSKNLTEPTRRQRIVTQSGALLGTPHYMASEQLLGGEVDERTDLYAVGVMLYQILAGRTPFEGRTVGQVIAAALRHRVAPLRGLRSDVSPRLEAIVERAMHQDPDCRYGSAREMLTDLLSLDSVPGDDVPVAAARPAQHRPPQILASTLRQADAQPRWARFGWVAAACAAMIWLVDKV